MRVFQAEVMVWAARMANLAGLQTKVVIEVVVHDESLESVDERHGMGVIYDRSLELADRSHIWGRGA